MNLLICTVGFLFKVLFFDIIYVSGYGVLRSKQPCRWMIVPIIIMANSLLITSGIGAWGEMITYFLSVYIITCFCYWIDIKRGVMAATLSIFMIGTLETVLDMIVGVLFGKICVLNDYLVQIISDICIALFLFFVIRKILQRMQGCLNYMKFSHGLYYVFVLTVNLLTMVGLYAMVETEAIKQTVRQRFLIILILAGISALFQIAVIVYLAGYRYLSKEKEILISEYLEQQNQHYHYLEKKEGELRRFQHDIRDHLGMLQLLSEQGRNLELKEYLEQICGKMNKLTSDIHTGNSVVDAILNYYVSLCQEKEIILSVKAHFPRETQIEEYDICTIFSNLLRNAVEAAQCSIEKEVNVEVWYDREAIYITIKNTFADKPVLDGKKWLSAKREYKHPGYGLFNIRECVDKYCGCFDYDIVDREFHAMVILYLEQRDLECKAKLRL